MLIGYNKKYYEFNNQNADRIGNLFYKNIIKRNFKIQSYLDFGCGLGFLLKKIEKIKGLKITCGFEINDFAIKKSIMNTRRSDIFKNLDDINHKFDLISMLHVVEHISDDDLSKLLLKIKSKLSKNGKLLISTPAKNGLAHHIKKKNWIGYKDPTHINLKNYQDWLVYFNKENLILDKAYSDGLWDFPYGGIINHLKYIRIYFAMLIQIFFGILILNYNQGETFIFILQNND